MKIVIEIDDNEYKNRKEDYDLCNKYGIKHNALCKMIVEGIQLPKGHGKIIDADKIEWYGCMSEEDCPHKNIECKDCDRAECDKRQVDAITAIVEADGGE